MGNDESLDDLAVKLLGKTAAGLSGAERRVLMRIHHRELTCRNLTEGKAAESSFGQRLADRVAAVGGSWAFIISFMLVLFGWMIINSPLFDWAGIRFDPYPFIFLNLMLSMLAAIQAPIIMMSQNRQSEKDRDSAAHDYEVNLRAELEIIRLHEKLGAVQHDLTELLAAHRMQSS